MSGIHERSPIGFAHRGGRAHFRENTLVAFQNALDAGLKALETDAWLSADSEVVLNHDGVVRTFLKLRKRRLAAVHVEKLPKHIPTLAALCEIAGPDVDVQIDVKGDVDIAQKVIETWRKHWPDSMGRLWLAHDGYKSSDWRRVATWREFDPEVHLVDSTTVKRFDMPVEQYLHRANDVGIEVINLPAREWGQVLMDQVHANGLRAFGFNAQKPELIDSLIGMGIDGVYSDHVDRLMTSLQRSDS